MSRIILPFNSSRLSFPGRPAGVDTSHIAFSNVRMSAVAKGNNFYSLLTGLQGTPSGTTATINNLIGPAVTFVDNSTNIVNLNASSLALPSNATLAVIAVFNVGSGFDIIVSPRSGNLSTWLLASRGFLELYNGTTEFNSNLTPAANVPYFAVASTNSSNINFVLKRLDTGQVQTASLAGAAPTGAEGTYSIGGFGTGNAFGGSIATAMYAANYLSMPQLLEWADDPWAFWYPRTLDLVDMLSIIPTGDVLMAQILL